MKRRLMLTAPLGLALGSAMWLAWTGAQAQPSYNVSQEQLQKALAQRFPLRYPAGGLFDLNVQSPQLRLLPKQNRLGADMVIDANGPLLREPYAGTFDVDFALRYEPSDQTIRAYQLKVNALRLTGLPPGPAALIEAYAPALAKQTLLEVTVHKLRPQDLALADTMGLEPSTITVTNKGLTIGFVNKVTPTAGPRLTDKS